VQEAVVEETDADDVRDRLRRYRERCDAEADGDHLV
jgi:hypothetical protein